MITSRDCSFIYHDNIYSCSGDGNADIELIFDIFDADLGLRFGVQQVNPPVWQGETLRKPKLRHMSEDGIGVGQGIFSDDVLSGADRNAEINGRPKR